MNDFAKAWVTALRSGEYPQALGRLRSDDAYCCLGVACELFRQMYGEGEWEDDTDIGASHFSIGIAIEEGILPDRVRDALGLADSEGGYYDNGDGISSLIKLNDDGTTFAEIAGIIESEPRWLFVEASE